MALFNALYTLGGCRKSQPVHEDSSTVTIELASRTKCQKFTIWAKWLVTFPVTAAHGIYNIYLMAKCKEIHEPVGRQVYKGNVIHYMPSIVPRKGISFHIISSPRVIHAITPHFRNDPKGLFQGKVIEEVFLPLLCDLYPQTEVCGEDFLFTCSSKTVQELRAPFEHFIGPDKLRALKPQMAEVTDEVLQWLAKKERAGSLSIPSRELTELFSVTIISKLFLNHPGILEDYQRIGKAATFALNFQLIRRWTKPSAGQERQYEEALGILRAAIELCQGEFLEFLQDSQMSPIRIKGTLLLAYIAGSDTTSSALEYILWRFGKRLDLQWFSIQRYPSEGEENPRLEGFISECLRLYTPADLFSRYARQDLVIKVKNKTGKAWEYSIWKGDGIMCSPYLAGRNSSIFSSPNDFSPERFHKVSDQHPHKPFSEGKHGCPGRWFARAEMTIFLSKLLQRYEINSSPNKKELAMKGFMTLKVEDTRLELTRRVSA